VTDYEELFTAKNARKKSKVRYGKKLANFAKCFAPLAVKRSSVAASLVILLGAN
jgi:hypothetical protein